MLQFIFPSTSSPLSSYPPPNVTSPQSPQSALLSPQLHASLIFEEALLIISWGSLLQKTFDLSPDQAQLLAWLWCAPVPPALLSPPLLILLSLLIRLALAPAVPSLFAGLIWLLGNPLSRIIISKI